MTAPTNSIYQKSYDDFVADLNKHASLGDVDPTTGNLIVPLRYNNLSKDFTKLEESRNEVDTIIKELTRRIDNLAKDIITMKQSLIIDSRLGQQPNQSKLTALTTEQTKLTQLRDQYAARLKNALPNRYCTRFFNDGRVQAAIGLGLSAAFTAVGYVAHSKGY